ncbi:MAG: toxin-antitoxin system, antitoxin component [Leptospiraceae bacterium]|nr:toxin-antitoxin system, antitoxin component [Leptospiraceae bacterium]NUM41909.1 toxin-antitoxin system, antitoxin component [Leptospiraceae bacterium]
MKEECDFLKGARGVYLRNVKDLHFPIYLEPELEEYYRNIALKKNKNLSLLVNMILQKEMELHNSYF